MGRKKMTCPQSEHRWGGINYHLIIIELGPGEHCSSAYFGAPSTKSVLKEALLESQEATLEISALIESDTGNPNIVLRETYRKSNPRAKLQGFKL